jgi:hypothetical protein
VRFRYHHVLRTVVTTSAVTINKNTTVNCSTVTLPTRQQALPPLTTAVTWRCNIAPSHLLQLQAGTTISVQTFSIPAPNHDNACSRFNASKQSHIHTYLMHSLISHFYFSLPFIQKLLLSPSISNPTNCPLIDMHNTLPLRKEYTIVVVPLPITTLPRILQTTPLPVVGPTTCDVAAVANDDCFGISEMIVFSVFAWFSFEACAW